MATKRRDFLKQAGLAAGVAATAGACGHMGGGGHDHARMAGGGHDHGMPGGARARTVGGPMPRGMTFVTIAEGRDNYRLGVKTPRGILDVAHAAKHYGSGAPDTIDDLIKSGDAGITDLVRKAEAEGHKPLYLDEASIRFGPCVTNPQKIVCVGLNYAKHARETNNPIPKLPILFNKFNNALNHHNGVVRVSNVPATNFDYESELVIVMGRRAHNVSEADALSYVFGYCNGNDFTARDLQSRSSQWMIGKTNDGFGLLGPYLVTADQVDPNNLKIVGTVNGEVRQSSNTNDMVFNCAQIISYTSKLFTLEPGDIIYTGTVAPQSLPGTRKQLRPGDVVEVEIEGIGVLRNTMIGFPGEEPDLTK